MPDDTILIPVEGRGERKMASNASQAPETGDVDTDCMQLLLEETFGDHKIILNEISANIEQAGAVGRAIGNRLVGRVQPMEAAAVTTVLSE